MTRSRRNQKNGRLGSLSIWGSSKAYLAAVRATAMTRNRRNANASKSNLLEYTHPSTCWPTTAICRNDIIQRRRHNDLPVIPRVGYKTGTVPTHSVRFLRLGQFLNGFQSGFQQSAVDDPISAVDMRSVPIIAVVLLVFLNVRLEETREKPVS